MRPLDTYPYVIAHRGVTTSAHENTIAAFEEAIRQGADFIECDIRQTGDGIRILHHDHAVGPRQISISTLAELQQAASMLGYQINTLDDLLTNLRGLIRVDFELKEQGSEAAILDQIAAANWPLDSFVVTSFNDESVRAIKSANPAIRCGLLLGVHLPEQPFRTRLSELFPVRRLRRCGADFAVPNIKLLRLGFLRRVTRAGFAVWVWTVNRPRDIAQIIRNQQIEAIITDETKLVCQQCDAFKP